MRFGDPDPFFYDSGSIDRIRYVNIFPKELVDVIRSRSNRMSFNFDEIDMVKFNAILKRIHNLLENAEFEGRRSAIFDTES